MKFKMKVEDLFRVADKVIFAGDLSTTEKAIPKSLCSIYIDGDVAGEITIEGEVSSNRGHRDLWTTDVIDFGREVVIEKDVWLIAQ